MATVFFMIYEMTVRDFEIVHIFYIVCNFKKIPIFSIVLQLMNKNLKITVEDKVTNQTLSSTNGNWASQNNLQLTHINTAESCEYFRGVLKLLVL